MSFLLDKPKLSNCINLNKRKICIRTFDLSQEIGEMRRYDVLYDKGLMVVYYSSGKKNIPSPTIYLLDVNTRKLLDSIAFQSDLEIIRFSTYGTSIVGYSMDRLYIWHIRQGKLFLIYIEPAVFESCTLNDISQAVLHKGTASYFSVMDSILKIGRSIKSLLYRTVKQILAIK